MTMEVAITQRNRGTIGTSLSKNSLSRPKKLRIPKIKSAEPVFCILILFSGLLE